MSRLATARASTAGGRSGRLRTFGAEAHAARAGGDEREQRPGVEEPRLVRVVLEGDEVEPAASASSASATTCSASPADGRDEDAELEVVPVVAHAASLPAAKRVSGIRDDRHNPVST